MAGAFALAIGIAIQNFPEVWQIYGKYIQKWKSMMKN